MDPVHVHFDAFELDEVNARLLREGQPLPVAPKPFALLCVLVRQPGSLITKGALLDAVWGHRYLSESVLKTSISELRTALGDDARHPRYIETVSRRGYRFIGRASAAPAAQPIGEWGLTPPAQAFIGRTEAVSRLHQAWDLALTGKRTMVWVAGDPGTGKTTLVDHFVAQLRDVAIGRGQCVEQYGDGEPYLPILDAIAELCRADPTAAELLRTVAPLWLLQLPWLTTAEERETLRRELAGARLDRMPRELGEFFDRYTEHRPLVLVTEDLQWSDHATIPAIDYVARRRGHGRLMWIGTFRVAEIMAQEHPLKAVRNELRLHALCDEIMLDAFSEEEVAAYIAQRAPSLAATESDVRALHQRTDGLPLFVAQLVGDLAARKSLTRSDVSAATLLERMAIPENLDAIIDYYVARFTSEQRAVLEAAAVCGIEFSVDTVATVLGQDAASVAATCDMLARTHRWLVPESEHPFEAAIPTYRFRHALFHQGLYERIAPRARTQLHRRVGAALEPDRAAGIPVAATKLVMHFERGGEPKAALRHCVRAAESALHVSPTEVMRLTERGLALVDRVERDAERDALELSLWTVRGLCCEQLFGMGSDDAKVALQRACRLLDDVSQHPARGALLFGLGFILSVRAEFDDALALAEQIEVRAQQVGDPALLIAACTIQGEVQLLRGQPRIARQWLERGIEACDSLGDASQGTVMADPRVTLLGQLAEQLLHLGLVERARACLAAAHTRARDVGHPIAKGVAIWCESLVEMRLGNTERVAVLADEIGAIAADFAFAQGHAGSKWMRGWVQARRGDPNGGFRLIREAYEELLSLGVRAGGSEVLGLAAEALVRAGDWDAAQQQLDEALDIVKRCGERVYLPQLLLIEGSIAEARGDLTSACESMRGAVAEARLQEAPWLQIMALRALCVHDDATDDERRALAELTAQVPEAAAAALG
jgi:DNA-binding winged helix-turn-helix (wHTH) protein/tetratricopeptide (TPR) repeat protein